MALRMLLWQMVSRGNAVLKSIEGTAMGIMGLLKTAITGGGLRERN